MIHVRSLEVWKAGMPPLFSDTQAGKEILFMPKAATQKEKSIYGVHPGVAMTQKWVAELKQKTGRSLDEWLRLIKKSGPRDEKARREWLKTEHGLGTNSAWWLAERADGKGSEVG